MVSGDRELDLMELECENLAVSLLALQQPMGRDLRMAICLQDFGSGVRI